MPTLDLNSLSTVEIARRVAAGETTAVAVTEACLARIKEREGDLHAWAFVDPELALQQAHACDCKTPQGLLHGVPLGIKDIIDTHDMPTEMGSPIYAGRRPAADAACVALARGAGAVILGKTVTTEFAGSKSGPTTNPHDVTRSPGGSSSGSAPRPVVRSYGLRLIAGSLATNPPSAPTTSPASRQRRRASTP